MMSIDSSSDHRPFQADNHQAQRCRMVAGAMDGSVACPLQTQLAQSWQEQLGPGTQLPDLR
jgi:hypothetical protein